MVGERDGIRRLLSHKEYLLATAGMVRRPFVRLRGALNRSVDHRDQHIRRARLVAQEPSYSDELCPARYGRR